MKVAPQLQRIRVDFNVTEAEERFVYLYLIVIDGIHIIDTGVAGSDLLVSDYLKSIGRDISEVKTILLTHAHPDHIGGAAAIRAASNATVFASAPEKPWIEDIDTQFAERPIPNFYTLLDASTEVDRVVAEGDVIALEDGLTINVIDTRGHSAGSVSYLWVEQGALFTGDAIPVVGDIPIYVSAKDSLATLEKLRSLEGVAHYLPAWDEVYEKETGKAKIEESLAHLQEIDDAVRKVLEQGDAGERDQVYEKVCATLGLEGLVRNPLFKTSVSANIKEAEC